MRKAIVSLLALLLLVAGCAKRAQDFEQVSPRERIVIKFSHVVAENSPKGGGATRFAQAVKERTGGHIEVQVFPNSQLFKDGEELTALKDGSVQIIAPATAKLASIHPGWQVFDLPYLFQSPDEAHRLFTSPLGLELRQATEAKGFIALALWPNGFKQMTNRVRPLRTPADYQGLRFRIQSSGVIQAQFQALGARPIQSTFDTLYASLERREVDGQENTLNNIYTRSLHEVQPYLTLSNHGLLAYVVLVNADWWQQLDPDLRERVREALAEASKWVSENADQLNAESLEKLRRTARVSIHTPTAEERRALQEAMAPAYQELEGLLGKEFVQRAIETVQSAR
jgi:tripartite ATP-independent transporter DctP family solute receptor